jgi:hypothetical protein
MWMQLQLSLQTSAYRTQPDGTPQAVCIDTCRQLRSAVAQWSTWALLLSNPESLVHDRNSILNVGQCRITDSHELTMFFKGFSARLGSKTRASVALLRRHVVWLDTDLNRRYHLSTVPVERQELARAGFANLLFYLGGLRSAEALETLWSDFTLTEIVDGGIHNLPQGVGCLEIRLLPETKTNRLSTADVIIAHTTDSGLSVGRWFTRLRRACGLSVAAARLSPARLFTQRNGCRWTSRYFRETYLYPALDAQRLDGDAYLRAYDGSQGQTIGKHFYSMHSYRRCFRSECTRGPTCADCPTRKKANEPQIYEHGRWRRRRSGEAVDVLYRDWAIRDRVFLTQECL